MPTSENNKISGKEVKHLLKRGLTANNALLTHWGRRTCSNVQNEILIAAEGVCLLQTPPTITRKFSLRIIRSLPTDALMADTR